MKVALKFQAVITEIAAAHNFDLGAFEAHLRLANEGYQPLVIEKIGPNLISVAHYAYQNGDAMPDPDVVCFTGYEAWVPIEISQILGYTCAAWLTDDGQQIDRVALDQQKEIARFCEMWAQEIRVQGWLQHGQKD